MSEARFCGHCGRPLSTRARFCEACGTAVEQNPEPAAPIYAPAPPAYPPSPPYQQPSVAAPSSSAPVKQRHRFHIASLIAILVGVMMLFFALRFPLLSILGSEASAIVTDTRQVIDSSNDRMEYNYKIHYSFQSEDGKKIQSTYQMNKVYNISNLPRIDSTIRVLYLPQLPQVNMPQNQPPSILATLGAGALGVVLIVLSIRGNISGSWGNRRNR